MEKEFISYEQALALKELGFDEHHFSYYSPCITFSQAFRWFREKYDLYTQDFIDLDNKFTKNIVKVLKNGQDFFYLDYYKTYEEAELECLKKLIEIVKSK